MTNVYLLMSLFSHYNKILFMNIQFQFQHSFPSTPYMYDSIVFCFQCSDIVEMDINLILYLCEYYFLEILEIFLFFFNLFLVTESYTTLCKPMNYSRPGFPVFLHFPKLAQAHVHGVCEAIQPSRLLLFPSSPALSLSQQQGLFQ